MRVKLKAALLLAGGIWIVVVGWHSAEHAFSLLTAGGLCIGVGLSVLFA